MKQSLLDIFNENLISMDKVFGGSSESSGGSDGGNIFRMTGGGPTNVCTGDEDDVVYDPGVEQDTCPPDTIISL